MRIEAFTVNAQDCNEETGEVTYEVSFMDVPFMTIVSRRDEEDAMQEAKDELASALSFIVGKWRSVEAKLDL